MKKLNSKIFLDSPDPAFLNLSQAVVGATGYPVPEPAGFLVFLEM